MPELPEVETVRRGLAPAMEGERINAVTLARADLRFPFPKDFAQRLAGRRIERLDRRAKYLLARLCDGNTLLMHLGMSGAFRVEGAEPLGTFVHARGKLAAHDHVRFVLSRAQIVYNDPRRFGYMTLAPTAELADIPLMRHLGMEPVRGALTAQRLAEGLKGRRTPLKAALLDQRLIAGLGNIYVCEALWRARLSPRRMAGSLVTSRGLPTRRAEALTDAIVTVIEEAIAAGGSTLRDYVAADGSLGRFQHNFSVYGREEAPCPRRTCPGAIARIVQSNRSTFYCPRCQR